MKPLGGLPSGFALPMKTGCRGCALFKMNTACCIVCLIPIWQRRAITNRWACWRIRLCLAGLLSNKYKGGAECPAGSRMSINNDMFGRITPRLWDAIAAYKAIADKHGYDMVGMCIAWLQTRPFMGSVIPGATSVEQLRPILESTKLTLSAEAMADIAVAHKAWPMPF